MFESGGTRNKLASRLLISFAASCLLCGSLPRAVVALSVTPDFAFTLSVDPPQPKVGDTVRLTFTVTLRSGGGGLPAYSLSVDPTILAGDAPSTPHQSYFPDTVSFERRAVSAGTARVQLHVNYEAGVEHEDGSCCVWFFTNAQSPLFELAVLDPDDQSPTVSSSCDGDCDGDGRVRVDELTRSVGIALGRLTPDSCPSLPMIVTVDMVVRAVDAALHGCSEMIATATPTPTFTATPLRPIAPTATPTRGIDVTESGVDLEPLNLVPARCLGGECLAVSPDSGSVCVANRGDQHAGPFLVDVNDATRVLLEGVPSGVGVLDPSAVIADLYDADPLDDPVPGVGTNSSLRSPASSYLPSLSILEACGQNLRQEPDA